MILKRCLYLVCCGVFIAGSCTRGNKNSSVIVADSSATKIKSHGIEIEIFPNGQSGFGYNIYRDGKPIIHQASPPNKAGNNGFPTKEAAQKTADLVVYKLANNLAPAINQQELDSLGIK